jgi:hydroxymethylglutaryl-CoA lyase/(R)-citramalyl-CoA lyase
MTASIDLCEVGPRDGLQNLARHFSVVERVELIDRLTAAGVRHVEAVSFVNPLRVPQMADAEAVLARIARPEGLQVAGLVLNETGAERAMHCVLDELRFVLIASETFSQRNQRASVADNVNALREVAGLMRGSRRKLTAVIGASYGCPFEGRIAPEVVRELAAQAVKAGAQEISLADTIGVATPPQVDRLTRMVRADHPDIVVGAHLHNTRNMGLANAYAAIEAGATVLDASIGGLGGCPFAPKATGNIATEDLLYLLDGMQLETPLHAQATIDVTNWLRERVPADLSGRLAIAGWFPPVADRSL